MNYRDAGRLAAADRLQKNAGLADKLSLPFKIVGRAGKKLVKKIGKKQIKKKLLNLFGYESSE